MNSIQEITWAGLASQSFTIKPAVDSVVTLPPHRVDGPERTLIYSDTVRVNLSTLPKTSGVDRVNPWFVQRLILSSDPNVIQLPFTKAGQPPIVVKTTDLPIDRMGIAKGIAYTLDVSIGLLPPQWVRYQLVRYRVGVGQPGQPTQDKLVPYVLEGSAVDIRPQPKLGQPAYAEDPYRPLPCEFETVSFELLGKQGQVLQTIQSGAYPPINVPTSEAKTQFGPPDGPTLTYTARWTLKRINLPNYPPTQGYTVQYGPNQYSKLNELMPGLGLSKQDWPMDIGQTVAPTFDVYRAVGDGVTIQELCFGNVVTNAMFTGQDIFASVQAEANFILNW